MSSTTFPDPNLSPPKHEIEEIEHKPDIRSLFVESSANEPAAPAQATAEKGKTSDAELEKMIDDFVERMKARSKSAQTAVAPYARKLKGAAETRPITFTFLSLMLVFGLIPASVILFSVVSATLVVGCFAFFSFCFALIGICSIALMIAVPIAMFVTMLAVGATGTLIAGFLAHRFYLHVREAFTIKEDESLVDRILYAIGTFYEETLARLPVAQPVAVVLVEEHHTSNEEAKRGPAGADDKVKQEDPQPIYIPELQSGVGR